MEREEVERIVSEKINHIGLQYAEKRLNFLLWFGGALLGLFGVILPMWLTSSSTERVDKEILSMEKRFEELAGKQLRRPLIECSYENKSLEGQVVDLSVDASHSTPIIIRNVGDGPTPYMDFRLYLALDEPMPNLSISWWNPLEFCDEPGYTRAFDYTSSAQRLHPKGSFGLKLGQWGSAKKGSSAQALLKVYYGEQEPRIVKWSVKFK